MRSVKVGLLVLMVGLAGAAAHAGAGPANACVGSVTTFDDALRYSDGPVFSGRVTRVEINDTFWLDLTVDIDNVVRGPASSEVERAQAAAACDGIHEGEWGYVVQGIDDPEDGRAESLFFRMRRAAAREALAAAGLPDTSTSIAAVPETAPSPSWFGAAIAIIATTALLLRLLERRRRADDWRAGWDSNPRHRD